MLYRILVINPKYEKTKIAVYENEQEIFLKTIYHSSDDLIPYKKVCDQMEFRKRLITTELMNNELMMDFNAIVGVGGLVKPIRSGTYEVSERLKEDLRKGQQGEAACNLGGLIAAEIASSIPGARAFISNPAVVDEMDEIAKITGLPEIPRRSKFHALNQKMAGRKFAKEHNSHYEDLNLIIAHLGRGISIAAHRKGRVVDVNNAIEGSGPFSSERVGTLPAGDLITLCFSGKYTEEELNYKIRHESGLYAHLGTNDANTAERLAADGDKHASLILKAMSYNIAKEIAAVSIALEGVIDGIILTGAIAYNQLITEQIFNYVRHISPVTIYPGENEMLALAENALEILKGEYACLTYQ